VQKKGGICLPFKRKGDAGMKSEPPGEKKSFLVFCGREGGREHIKKKKKKRVKWNKRKDF